MISGVIRWDPSEFRHASVETQEEGAVRVLRVFPPSAFGGDPIVEVPVTEENADDIRRLCGLLLGVCEDMDPKGYVLMMPREEVARAAE